MKAMFYRSMTGDQIPALAFNLTTTRRARKRRPLFGALLSALIGAALPSAFAANWAWNTSPGSANFNAPNWISGTVPGAGVATPATGDSLYFGASGQLSLNNDFSSYAFGGINFNSAAGVYVISGNAFTNFGNIVNSSANLQTINANLVLNAPRVITTAASGGDLTLGGNISGAFALTNNGPGVLTLSGANTYGGGTVNGGTLNYSGSLTAIAANLTVNSRLNVSGTLAVSNLWIGHVNGGAGAVYQTGGSVTQSQTAGVDNFRVGSGTNSSGYYNFSGGSVNAGQVNVTSAGRGDNTIGVLDITGGAFTNSDRFAVGTGVTAGRGVATISGGTLNFSTTANGLSLIANGANAVGSGVTGILNVGGGAAAAQVIGPSTTTPGRGLVLAGVNITNALAVASLLPNGTLTVNGVSVTQPTPISLFNFNGGTLKATALNLGSSFFSSANLSGAYVYGNGGTIDNNGTAISVSNPLRAPSGNGVSSIASFTGGAGYLGAPFVAVSRGGGDTTGFGATAIAQIDASTGNATSGQVTNVLITNPGNSYTVVPTFTLSGGGATSAATITGAAPTANVSGGLTFIGSGRTTLSGVSTYTGITTVSAGTLALSGAGSIANSSAIILATGATLDVSAATPAFALSASQILSNNTSTAWLNGNLIASAGRLGLNFVAGSPSFTVTNGALILSTSTVVQINNTGAQLAPGSYLLVARATAGNAGQVVGAVTVPVVVGGAGANGSAWLQISGKELYLNVSESQVVSTLDSSSNPSGYLDPVTFLVNITDLLPASVATGDVVFAANNVPFSTNAVVAGNVSSSAIASLPRSAANLITAIYSGDANHPALTNTLVQSVTNHPPSAGQVNFQRATNDNTIVIPISQLLATTSDVDGDTVSFAGVGTSIRGITPTINGGSLIYSNANNVNDVIPFTVSDGFGGTGPGQIIIQRQLLPGQVAKHNILLLIADDLGAENLALFNSTNSGASLPPTPNLDALGRRGVVFPRFYGRPSCSQFRAALITGQHSFRNDVGVAIGSVPLRTNNYTLPRAFTTNAPEYALAQFGKYHLSLNTDLNGPWTTAGWTNYAGFFSPGVANYTNWTKISNGASANVTAYATTDQVNDAISFIQSQGTNRWFTWLAFAAPHSPYHKPPANLLTSPKYLALSGASTDINTNTRPYFEAMIEAMDTEIGRLISAVDTNDTDIIFVADNGSPIAVQQPPYKTAAVAETLSGNGHAKFTVFEGGVADPLFITGPSVVNGGRTNHTIVDTVDLWQTIQELAGIDVAASKPANVITDSKSIVPALKADVIVPQPYLLSEQFNQSTASDGVSLRNERFKLIHWYSRVERFYDLQNDPYEFTNLLTTPLTAVAQSNFNALKLKLAEYFTLPNNKNTRNLVPWPTPGNVVYSNGTFVVNAQFTQLTTNLFAANPNQDELTRYRDGGTNINYQVILWRSSVLNDPLAWTPVATNIVSSVTGNTFISTNGPVADLNANADHYFYRLTPYFQ